MTTPRFLIATTALALAIAPTPVLAAEALVGTWTYDTAKSDNVDQAIDATVEKVNFVIRGFASSKLKNTNKPYGKVVISVKDKTTTIQKDGRTPITAPKDGTSVKWTREDKTVYDVTLVWKSGSHLEETFSNAEGKRVNVYSLNADGKTMKLAATVSSDKLPVPLTYSLSYKK